MIVRLQLEWISSRSYISTTIVVYELFSYTGVRDVGSRRLPICAPVIFASS
jgi:hypothetical protein